MREFLALDRIRLRSANVGHLKDYGAHYKLFRQAIRFPGSLLEEIYTSRFVRQFYSQSEIDGFRQNWTK